MVKEVYFEAAVYLCHCSFSIVGGRALPKQNSPLLINWLRSGNVIPEAV